MATVVVTTILLLPFGWLLAEADFSSSYWREWFGNYGCLPGLLPAHLLMGRWGTQADMWMAAAITVVVFLGAVSIGRLGRRSLMVVAAVLLTLIVSAAMGTRAVYLA